MEANKIRQKLGISKIQWREVKMKLEQLAGERLNSFCIPGKAGSSLGCSTRWVLCIWAGDVALPAARHPDDLLPSTDNRPGCPAAVWQLEIDHQIGYFHRFATHTRWLHAITRQAMAHKQGQGNTVRVKPGLVRDPGRLTKA